MKHEADRHRAWSKTDTKYEAGRHRAWSQAGTEHKAGRHRAQSRQAQSTEQTESRSWEVNDLIIENWESDTLINNQR